MKKYIRDGCLAIYLHQLFSTFSTFSREQQKSIFKDTTHFTLRFHLNKIKRLLNM